MGKYGAMATSTSFDLGTFPESNDIKSVFVLVYPKFYGTTYDFVGKANFTFKFCSNGIMGEGLWTTSV